MAPGPQQCDLPRPMMRGMHHAQSMRNVMVAVIAAAIAASTVHFGHNQRRKAIYKAFYDNYDADKAFARMRSGGVFCAMPPEDENDGKKKK